jgi:large conductance mechanosensitive channel
MSLWKEFKAFAMKGNVIDMAVGIIIGAAFGKIVTSLVNDVIMPPIGVLLGKTDFSAFGVTIKNAVMEGDKVIAEAVRINYGMFINAVINFLIVAVAIFALIKVINMAKKKEEAAPAPAPAPSNQEVLLAEIRDILKRK